MLMKKLFKRTFFIVYEVFGTLEINDLKAKLIYYTNKIILLKITYLILRWNDQSKPCRKSNLIEFFPINQIVLLRFDIKIERKL